MTLDQIFVQNFTDKYFGKFLCKNLKFQCKAPNFIDSKTMFKFSNNVTFSFFNSPRIEKTVFPYTQLL